MSEEKPKQITCKHQWIPYRAHVSSASHVQGERGVWEPLENWVVTTIKCIKCGKEEKL